MDPASLVLLLVMLVAFWLLIIRPARTRQQQIARVQSSVQPGSRVMTGGGLYGTVTAVEGDVVHLEVAPGVSVQHARAGISRVLDTAAPGAEESPDLRRDNAPDGPAGPQG